MLLFSTVYTFRIPLQPMPLNNLTAINNTYNVPVELYSLPSDIFIGWWGVINY